MDLPRLLAGPILRRTEDVGVNIWLATSRNYVITPKVYELEIRVNQSDIQYMLIPIVPEIKTVQMGEKLYISLISIKPMSAAFPKNKLLAYDLIFQLDNELLDLEALHLLDPNSPT